MWLELYMTPVRYHIKWNRLDFQLLLRKGAGTRRIDFKRPAESGLKNGNNGISFVIIIISSSSH